MLININELLNKIEESDKQIKNEDIKDIVLEDIMDEEKYIKENLKDLVDEKYRSFHTKLCPNVNNILGIRVPVLRNYAKELNKKYESKYLLANIGNDYYEEIMLQGMIIGLNKKFTFKELANYIKDFVPKIDNWAICDTFCSGLKITQKYKNEMFELIKDYLKFNKEFELRFAIVMLLDYYIEKQYLQRLFEIFNNVKSDKYYVKMAVAWAISICLIKFYDEAVEYLESDSKLDEWTHNKAIQKAIESYRLTKEQKEKIKMLKVN